MRIASAEAIGFTFDHDREPLSYCLIRVVTDNGIVGWGEACDSFGLALMIDGNENFTVDTALAVAEELAECWATIAPGCPLVPDQVVDGALRPPDEPGLGVEIDYEAVRSRPYQPPAARTGPSPRYAGNV